MAHSLRWHPPNWETSGWHDLAELYAEESKLSVIVELRVWREWSTDENSHKFLQKGIDDILDN